MHEAQIFKLDLPTNMAKGGNVELDPYEYFVEKMKEKITELEEAIKLRKRLHGEEFVILKCADIANYNAMVCEKVLAESDEGL